MARILRRVKDFAFRVLGAPNYLSSEAYVDYARERGCQIGEGTEFFGEKKLDLSLGPMIEIGENCIVTDRVRILAHTWDRPILTRRFGESDAPAFESVGPVTVGDNVFIGENTIILPDCEIGDDTIIGAGSVVATDIPPESVAVGNPCRVVMSLDEYRDKRVTEEEQELPEYLSRFESQGINPDLRVGQIFENSE